MIAPELRSELCALVRGGAALLPLLAEHGITPTEARDDVEFRAAYNEAKRAQVAQRKRA